MRPYAKQIQPWLSDTNLKQMADALNGAKEAKNCNVSAKKYGIIQQPPTFAIPEGTSFYVDPVKGSDSNSGTMQAPFLTISKAVMAARAFGSGAIIVLREGPHYLTDTIMLNDQDSGLTFQNYPNETVEGKSSSQTGKLLKLIIQ